MKLWIFLLLTWNLFQFSSCDTQSEDHNDDDDVEKPTIVGGQVQDLGSVPFAAAYYNMVNGFESFECGGSIVAPRYILTAAHCLSDEDGTEQSVVRVGSVSSDEGGQVISVVKKYIHPRFLSDGVDIALLLLQDNIQYNEWTKPVKLPESTDFEVPNGQKLLITGFGRAYENGNPTVRLMGANVYLIPLAVCQRASSHEIRLPTEVNLCAYADEVDACQGDSGGGLVWDKMIVGVISYGYGCSRKGYPGVYAKVAPEIDWIKETMAKHVPLWYSYT